MKKYSIITFHFNNYQAFHQVRNPSNECEYIYITDNPELKSDTWKIILQDEKLQGMENVWQKCFYIRYHLFEYCSSEVCICMDASIQIDDGKLIDKFVDDFLNSGKSLGLMVHPMARSIVDQIAIFANHRNYSHKCALNQGVLMDLLKYDMKNPMFQLTLRIQKNVPQVNSIDNIVFDFLKYTALGTGQPIDRLDQTLYSIVFNTFFSVRKMVMLFSEHIIHSSAMKWNLHGMSGGLANLQGKRFFFDRDAIEKYKKDNSFLYFIE